MHGGRMVVGVSALLAMVLAVIALAWLFQRRLIYLADPAKVPAATTIFHAGEDVAFDTADGLRLGGKWNPRRPVAGVAVEHQHGCLALTGGGQPCGGSSATPATGRRGFHLPPSCRG